MTYLAALSALNDVFSDRGAEVVRLKLHEELDRLARENEAEREREPEHLGRE